MSFGIGTPSILLMEVEPPSPYSWLTLELTGGLECRLPTTDYRLPRDTNTTLTQMQSRAKSLASKCPRDVCMCEQ